MSSFLFRLGRAIAGNARKVVLAWLLVLGLLGGLAAAVGGELNDEITIPGTESQEGLDVLETRFPEVSGTIGQIVYSAPEGGRITDHREAVEQRLERVRQVEDVRFAPSPFGKQARDLQISDDGRHALVQVQLAVPLDEVTDQLKEEVAEAAGDPEGLRVDLGGQMFTTTSTPVTATEAIGLGVALVVLVITLGSLVAAGIPLVTAVLGVGITMAGLIVVARFFAINSSTPSLAMMIGLAVGIDYALFLAARHRDQLAEGMAVEESVARSVATAGSAVIFAGATVIIALCGLVVGGIPFLSVMGVAAAVGVAVAVAVAVTLVPALFAMAGERLRPRGPRGRRVRDDRGNRARGTPGERWVRLVTRRPVITLGVGVIGLLLLAVPAKDLALGLPDTGSAPHDSQERITYDLIAEEYGPGFTSPLLVTVDIIRTREPIAVMRQIGRDIGRIDGVDTIALTTPNRKADLGIVQVIPEHGQTDPRTAELVREIRDRGPLIEERHDVDDLLVTGQTAVTIDVSDRLRGALLPFGLVVVGLSLLLLTIVFRSVAVPLKATVGYLFSVGAAFGATVLVFQHGWFADLVNVEKQGPLPSFLPIMLMGVLFGLAMDYEVFLVARMREDYVHHGEALPAIRRGFTSSARVVTAAAVIMITVFASFVPHGDSSVKPIAFGLAVGVLVDAFVVRMSLVPAVLALLRDRAWTLPAWLDRRLPSIDVEGEGLSDHLEHDAWVAEHGYAVVRAERVALDDPARGDRLLPETDLVLRPGQVGLVTGEPAAARALVAAVSGRVAPDHGRLVVLGRFLPAEAAAVRARVGIDRSAPQRGHALVLLDLTHRGGDPGAVIPRDLTDGVRHLADNGTAVLVAAAAGVGDSLRARLGDLVDVAVDLPPTRTRDHEEVLL
jgi:putative drug exporter of the RND superfamily